MRYNFYSHIHRFMRQYLFKFEGVVAKTDFNVERQRQHLKGKFEEFKALLEGHAKHEDNVYHPMLKAKEPIIVAAIESEHKQQDIKLADLDATLAKITSTSSKQAQIALGYEFYLNYTDFIKCYLNHLIQEEKVVMPALQQHYTDTELREVTLTTYEHMTPQQLVEMLDELFPYLNSYEKAVFVTDIKDSCPEKFDEVWQSISPKLIDPSILLATG